MNKKLKILIADDHPLIRRGVIWALSQNSEFEIAAEAETGTKAFDSLVRYKPDIATLDVEMPGMSGFDVARKAMENNIETRIIFLTMYKDEHMFEEAMRIGAMGYVLKENAIDDIVECIKKVSEGFNYISPALSHFLLKKSRELEGFRNTAPSINSLTKTERKILKYISEEKTSREIAESLFISLKTVENHRSNISKKLNLHGTHSLIKFALSNKLLF